MAQPPFGYKDDENYWFVNPFGALKHQLRARHAIYTQALASLNLQGKSLSLDY
jgi:hypothetical protein